MLKNSLVNHHDVLTVDLSTQGFQFVTLLIFALFDVL